MSTSALTQISSHSYLSAIWDKLWIESRPKSRDTHGVDDQSLNEFKKNSVSNISDISREIRHGTYQFSSLRPYFLEKPNGKLRVICIPTTRDRIVQGALLTYLSLKYTDRFSNEISYGFLKGRGVKKALQSAKKNRRTKQWVFKTDIKAFFDNINRNDLKSKIKKVIRERSLHDLLTRAIDCEIQNSSRTASKKLQSLGIQTGHGVRQGMPLSPFFSNVVLERFDKAVAKTGYSAIRYADDLIFFAQDRSHCLELEKFCIRQLKKEKLEIPPLDNKPNSKSIVYCPSDDAEFLGVAICKHKGGYQIRLLPNQIKSILKTFTDIGSVKELLSRRIQLGKLSSYLSARKSGYIQAYDLCSNIKELENSLDDIEQKILKCIYTKDLNINLSNLTVEAYSFLGLR